MNIGYLGAIAIAILFLLYLDGRIGVLMLTCLILMPTLSLILTLLVRHFLQMELVLPENGSKYQKMTALLRLHKPRWLPLPFLRVRLQASAHFAPLNPDAEELEPEPLAAYGFVAGLRYRAAYRKWRKRLFTQPTPYMLPMCLSMSIEEFVEIPICLTPECCGKAELWLSQMKISDFLGLFQFSVKQDVRETVLILPEIPDMKPDQTIFRDITNAVITADDEEEAELDYSASTLPGYEHRSYQPGDSLKRINWKLSTKRRQLMVRKDEPVSLPMLSLLLDLRRSTARMSERARIEQEECLFETIMGLISLCARNGFPCQVFYCGEAGAWKSVSIQSPEQIAAESILMLQSGFRSDVQMQHLPSELNGASSGVLLYATTESDAPLVNALAGCFMTRHIIVPEPTEQSLYSAMPTGSIWYATAEHHLVPAENG